MHNLKSLYKGGLGGHVCVQCRRYASVKGKTHYEILGVSRTASDKEIRSAYIELSKKHHPDTAGSKSKKKFTDISEAYSVLSKPLTRKEYDNKLTMDSMGQSSSNRYGPYSRPPGSGPASYPGGPQYEQYGRYNQYGQRENFYRPEGSSYSEYERKRWENSELRRRYEYFYGREGQQNRRRANASRAEFKSQEEQGKELTRIITFAMIFALVVTLLRIFPIKSMILSSRSDLRRSPSDEMKENMIKGPDLREKDISPPRF